MTTTSNGPASRETSADAVAFFADKLRFETDPSDVHAALEAGDSDLILVDTRARAAWDQGHIPGAIHMPTATIPDRARTVIPPGKFVVTYCWGPGCNGSTRAALALADLGYSVKEMIGGFEYWAREGLAVETDAGVTRAAVDPLTGPMNGPTCAC
jgi:rhodanese-related sulfurtransferase